MAQVFIEHDGALFRGPSRAWPEQVWSPRERAWRPYITNGEPKPVDWGSTISETEAKEIMAELAGF